MSATPMMLGWKEWCTLPGLGIPALRVKVDTGARTSSIHAVDIEAMGGEDEPKVRFKLHPVPGRPEIEIVSVADLVDQREVTSSNGETELRYVIETPIRIGEAEWRIQITLADREGMQFHMLLGRQAFEAYPGDQPMQVEPTRGYLQPTHNYAEYDADWGTGHALLREDLVYRLMTPSAWAKAKEAGELPWAAVDEKDGFFHLSSAAQVLETARLHYGRFRKLVGVGIDPALLDDELKWEESRGGQLFPHYYGRIAATKASYLLYLEQSGVEEFDLTYAEDAN